MAQSIDDLRNNYTISGWSPTYYSVVKHLMTYPIVNGFVEIGEDNSLTKIARLLHTSPSAVSRIKRAVELGVIVPTQEEVTAAALKGTLIPMRRFHPDFKPRWPESETELPPAIQQAEPPPTPPLEKPLRPIMIMNEPDITPAMIPHMPPEVPEVPEAPPVDKTEDEKEAMQKDIEHYLANPNKERIFPAEFTKPKQKAETPAPPKSPEEKPWRKEPEAKIPEPEKAAKAEPQQIEISEQKKKDKDNGRKMVGPSKDLFQMTRNIKLDFMSLFWFFHNVTEGYEGTIDEFINWCIKDCALARGLSVELVQNSMNIATEGRFSYEETVEGDGDGDN